MRLVLVAFLALAACTSTAPPGGGPVTQDQAVAIARSNLGGADLVSVVLGNRAGFVPVDESLRNTWIVKLRGDFPRGCPPGGTCPEFVHSATVIVDQATGEVVSTTYE